MTDPYAPPPRRPMPEQLQRRITDELATATSRHHRRVGSVVIPLVAAALVGTMVAVGVTAFRDRERVGPAETAGPVPVTALPTSSAPMTPSATATPRPRPTAPITTLDVRPMTKAEIAADTKKCRRRDSPEDLIRLRGTPRSRYAMVQRRAGWTGAGGEVRVLIIEDDASHWSCEDGIELQAGPGDVSDRGTSAATPVVEVENFGWSRGNCTGESAAVVGSEFFLAGDAVAVGRVRFVGGKHSGPWQTAKPVGGLIAMPMQLDGAGARERSVRTEFEFLDRNGDRLTIQPYGERGTPTTRSHVADAWTCADLADMRDRLPEPEKVDRPSSDAAGIRTCQAMAEESQNQGGSVRGAWKSRLIISTDQEWGTVLSDGRNLVGCSLYPTKEISPFIPDTAVVKKSAFYFAVNPIGATGASSLWAAGRVPTDVTKITYRLPGDREVAATIDDKGYWMLKHHTAAGQDIGSEDNSQDWPPVVVTVTRPSGAQRYSIEFSEETMCRQVSHGC